MKRSVLLDMLQRRHELAMACVARQHLDTVDKTRQSDGGYASPDSSDPSYDDTSEEGTQNASMKDESCPQHASFAMHTTETFKQWVERLCRSLPVVHRSRRYQAHVYEQGGASRVRVGAPPHYPPPAKYRPLIEQKLVLPETNRVVYQPQLPYAQFVAAIGVQLLTQASTSVDGSFPKMGILVECMLAIEVLLYCFCCCC